MDSEKFQWGGIVFEPGTYFHSQSHSPCFPLRKAGDGFAPRSGSCEPDRDSDMLEKHDSLTNIIRLPLKFWNSGWILAEVISHVYDCLTQHRVTLSGPNLKAGHRLNPTPCMLSRQPGTPKKRNLNLHWNSNSLSTEAQEPLFDSMVMAVPWTLGLGFRGKRVRDLGLQWISDSGSYGRGSRSRMRTGDRPSGVVGEGGVRD